MHRFSNDAIALQCAKSSQNKGATASINSSVIFFLILVFKWHFSINVFILMKADFSKAPEGNA